MKYFGEGLSEKHKELGRIIRKPGGLEQAKELFLELHAALHRSAVSGGTSNEVDALLSGLSEPEYAVMPTKKDETIAWVLWHTARIEDLTMGILAAGGEQLFDAEWKSRLGAPITDTGNALADEEIMELSKSLSIGELLNYRDAVGRRTREIVKALTAEEICRPVSREGLEKILREGGVTRQADSLWLLDFWGKKDTAGLLLMPPTRHVMLHLNDCCKWKILLRSRTKFFRS